MNDTTRVFAGREFSIEDIELIKWTRRTYSGLSRTELANTICENLNWVNDAGRPKTKPCKKFLEELESEGAIELPPLKKSNSKGSKKKIPEMEIPLQEIKGKARDFEPIRLEIVKAGRELKRWRGCINQYHMLGDKQVFGTRLQYFVKSKDLELGCIQFSASSWALEDRDKWLGWTIEDRKKRLHLIINNSRFLIFPWVHIQNLASKTLSLVAKQIQEDWLKQYCYAPVLLETFVDLDHFNGTCYKAANWIYIGKTKGRGRMDRKKEYSLSQKAIFMYPLQKDFKACLKGEKPYKVVTPDE